MSREPVNVVNRCVVVMKADATTRALQPYTKAESHLAASSAFPRVTISLRAPHPRRPMASPSSRSTQATTGLA